jgi:tRNA (guanine37-N1)-methyltransferase
MRSLTLSVLGLKVKKEDGERMRKTLLEEGLLLKNYRIKSSKEFVIFPLRQRCSGEIVEEEFEMLPPMNRSLREVVYGLRAYDIIGDIAIVEIPDELAQKRAVIGETLLSFNKNIKCVFEKKGEISGPHRTRPLFHLAGEKRTETIHREYGCQFALDIKKVFFSPRLATERKRIAGMVRDGEKVLDMFCGVGPFSIIIARYSQPREIHASDINEHAIAYLKKNMALNKVKNVFPYNVDARKIFDLVGNVDRCIMNLPAQGWDFIDFAREHSRYLHFYTIAHTLGDAVTRIRARGMTVISSRMVKEYSPQESIYCLDLETLPLEENPHS